MKLVCDLEIHSKYSRAVSPQMVIPEMVKWAGWKGIDVVGTGDCTHPSWLEHLEKELEEDETCLLRAKASPSSDLRFILTGEVSSIYSQGGRGRRVHTIVVLPSLKAAKAFNEKLSVHGKLASDGRPVLGLSTKKVLEYILQVNKELNLTDDLEAEDYTQRPGGFIVPAHVWTPWFGLFGSKSGFNSIEECFEELTPHVRAIETGLSSDLEMNWRLSQNNRLALVSFSDAHSAPNMMREATIVSVKSRTFADLSQALQNPKHVTGKENNEVNQISHTIEFYPEEGKYHYDGIATEKLRLTPQQTEELRRSDPAKAKKVTVGVLSRVEELADLPIGTRPNDRPRSISVIPLQEIIAETYGQRKQSKKVQAKYFEMVEQHSEYDWLVSLSQADIERLADKDIASAIIAMRNGKVAIEPGYDGVYGTISIDFSKVEKPVQLKKNKR